MDKKFMKEGKSAEEVAEVLKYVTQEDLKGSEMKGLYDNWAKQYDKDLQCIRYNPPIVLANEVEGFYGDQKDLRILDVAAGTGLCGKQLHIKGFNNLDALDASPKMLEKAKETGCYKQFYQQFLGQNKLNVPADSYDAVVTTGSFVPGHLNEDCYEDLISITKKGGRIFILMNQRYFTDAPEYSKNLEPRMQELEEEGQWKSVLKKTSIPKYHDDHMGVLFVMQKC